MSSEIQQRRRWWESRWWREEEYARLYRERVPPERVDRAMFRLAEVYDEKWAEQTPRHPMYGWLSATGTGPLQALADFGQELLALDGSLRLPSVVHDLRQESHFESARLELQIAARLRVCGHSIEFRPALPNGRQSDFVARHSAEQVYFEIKCLRESELQRALQRLSWSISEAFLDLVRNSDHPALSGQTYEVNLDPWVTTVLGLGDTSDAALIESFKNKILAELRKRLEDSQPLSFAIPQLATVVIGQTSDGSSSVNCPMAGSDVELKRVLRLLSEAHEQLHPDHPGIIVMQSQAALDPQTAEMAVGGLVGEQGDRTRHVSAVLVFPVFCSLPQEWVLFRPFAVPNTAARTNCMHLKAFQDLQKLLAANARVVGDTESA